ncbi:MAG: hypothetical protein M0Z79_08335 [Nitrospiraceae bacterium]|nr:hypothetical protein [Nitrospiraceae bacterium]
MNNNKKRNVIITESVVIVGIAGIVLLLSQKANAPLFSNIFLIFTTLWNIFPIVLLGLAAILSDKEISSDAILSTAWVMVPLSIFFNFSHDPFLVIFLPIWLLVLEAVIYSCVLSNEVRKSKSG